MTGFFKKLFGGGNAQEAQPQGVAESFQVDIRQGVVFRLPDAVAAALPKDSDLTALNWVESLWLEWEGRYFIYSHASLPLHDTASEPQHGLWVEVNKDDYDAYIRALMDRMEYARFTAHGHLANHWPGFDSTLGDDVRIQVLGNDGKPEVLEIFTDHAELAELAKKPSLTDAEKQALAARAVQG